MVEFSLEAIFWPESKGLVPCIIVGSVIFLLFWGLRVIAITTAGNSFNHSVYFSTQDHRLITHGIYRWIRHPAYLGYFGIVIGTQVVLSTPGTFVIGVILTFLFFYFRIPIEEAMLIEQYPEYLEYRNRSVCGIPFII
jgi:protein-S-isoprenylcysteine O-methyltransferase